MSKSSNNKDVRRGISLYIDGKEVENSVTSIKAELRKLIRDQEKMTQGSKEYVAQGKKIRELKSILREHRQQLDDINRSQSVSLSRGVDLFNKYAASAMAVIAALTGVVLKLNQFRKMTNERDEAKADVKALTGLDDNDIDWLEQQAIRLSTSMSESGVRIRQSATEILDAYKLVGSAKPELLSNRVALAEVTEQTLILASASGMKLKDAVDAVTLSMNQYSAGADQASRYTNVMAAGSKFGAAAVESITKTVLKSGTAASSANVSIEELVGTVETLAEKGIKNEEAGTALKNFFLTLQTGADDTNPKIVGLQTALENLKAKNLSANQVLEIFKKENFNVAKVLIENTEQVKYYTEAVTGTEVATEQAAIKSETLAAKLDQVKNEMNEQGMLLMKELNPAITKVLNNMVSWSKHTVSLVRFIADHRTTMTLLVAVIMTYTIWANRKILMDKLQVLWTDKLIVSTKALMTVLKSNPWLAVISAVTVIIGLFADYQRKQNQITQSMRSMESINKKTTEEFSKQAAKIDALTFNINNNNLSLNRRKKMLNELKSIIPGYNAQLNEEGILINNNTGAIKNYLKQLERKIKFKAAEEELEELFRNQRKVSNRIEDERKQMEKAHMALAGARFSASQQSSKASTSGIKTLNSNLNQSVKQMETLYNTAVKTVKASETELKDIASAIGDLNKELAASGDLILDPSPSAPEKCSKCGNDPCTCNPIGDEDRIKKELERLELEHQTKMLELKKRYLTDATFTEEDYNKSIEELDLKLISDKLNVAGIQLNDQQRLMDQLYNLKLKARDKENELEKQKLKEQKELQDKAHRDKMILLDRQRREEEMQLIDKRMAENMTEKEFNDQLKQIRLRFIEEKLAITSLLEDEKLSLQIEKQQIELENYIEHANQLRDKQLEYKDFIEDMAEAVGETLGEMFAGNEEGMRGMLKSMLNMILDYLEKVVLASIGQVTITSFTSLGAAAKAMGKIIAIKAAFAAVKSAVGNFYTGGYTGPGDWDDPQGIVHSNEFVANRFAVANPAVRPVLDLIDHAQRSGSINNLSSEDIAAVSNSSSNPKVMTIQNVTTPMIKDNADNVSPIVSECVKVMNTVLKRFEKPIVAETYATGKKGTIEAEKLVQKMENNVSRK